MTVVSQALSCYWMPKIILPYHIFSTYDFLREYSSGKACGCEGRNVRGRSYHLVSGLINHCTGPQILDHNSHQKDSSTHHPWFKWASPLYLHVLCLGYKFNVSQMLIWKVLVSRMMVLEGGVTFRRCRFIWRRDHWICVHEKEHGTHFILFLFLSVSWLWPGHFSDFPARKWFSCQKPKLIGLLSLYFEP